VRRGRPEGVGTVSQSPRHAAPPKPRTGSRAALLAITLTFSLAATAFASTVGFAAPEVAPLADVAGAQPTPQQAVAAGAAHAHADGVTEFVSVVDRSTGAILGQTSNANLQVASESIMKLFLAAYYLVHYGGYAHTPATVLSRLSYMLRYSDDATASAMFTATAIPTIAKRYGLSHTTNATDRVGHWGAARITANDMTRFLYRAAHDSAVGPWLLPVMAKTAAKGSDGFDQYFGLNALSGEHGSKQGWGDDSYWTSQRSAIHSVGYTSRYFVAVLQLSSSYPDPARATATYTATAIQQSVPGPPADGTFVSPPNSGAVYRMAGDAPIYVSSWSAVGGRRAVLELDTARWGVLRAVPRDGTLIRYGLHGPVYKTVGGAPTPTSSTSGSAVVVDPEAIDRAGGTGVWSHLKLSAAAAKCRPYPDVNGLNSACANITWLKGKAITKPADGYYHPRSSVTRGAMAAFLFRLANPGKSQPVCTRRPFPDVPVSSTFCGYIAWVAGHHIAFGYSDGTYRPANAVTRGAMAAYLFRIAGPGHGAKACTSMPFDDVRISDTFCGVITWAKRAGVTYGVGDGSDYGTTQLVTRQAMASFLHRIASL
jgi:hypothetical protein